MGHWETIALAVAEWPLGYHPCDIGILTCAFESLILRVGSDKGPVKRRLVDMGLTPGTYVTVRKVAPFGDPIEVNIRGYELSLRKEDAAQIAVTASDAEAQACRMERSRRKGMVQHIPDEETLRRMDADHEHEREYHAGPPDYTVEELQAVILAKMAANGPVDDQMRKTVYDNIWHDSLVNWVKSFR